jgi:large subunit ribosomal protein L19
MSAKLTALIKREYGSRRVPSFKVGDVVRVHQLVPDIKAHQVAQKLSKTAKAAMKAQTKKEEAGSTRVQIFEGVVIARKHGREPGASFTVRKIATGGVGVEKIFPLYSPLIQRVETVSRPKVRRAKLYFLRGRTGKAAHRVGTGVAVTRKEVKEPAVPGESAESTEETES